MGCRWDDRALEEEVEGAGSGTVKPLSRSHLEEPGLDRSVLPVLTLNQRLNFFEE